MKVNGNDFNLKEHTTLADFLSQQNYAAEKVAVELNGEIIPRKKFSEVDLTDSDTLEIVCFVGGG